MRDGRVILLALLLAAGPVEAQGTRHITVGATLSGMRRAAREAGIVRQSDGLLAGGNLTFRVGSFSLAGSYLEGTLEEAASGADLTYVEGSVAVMLRLVPWLAIGSGMRVHRVNEVDAERWVAWGAGARIDLPILGQAVRGHATYFQGLGGEVNFPDSEVDARSGEVGLTFGLRGRPFQVELVTRVDQNVNSGRSRTLQQLALGVGWNVW